MTVLKHTGYVIPHLIQYPAGDVPQHHTGGKNVAHPVPHTVLLDILLSNLD